MICPYCGAARATYGPGGRPALPAWRIVLGILSACGALGIGASGACFLVLANAMGGPNQELSGPIGIGLALVVGAAVFVAAAIACFRRPR